MKKTLLIALTILGIGSIKAQCDGRYQEEIFDDVSVSTVTYSDVNNLKVDIYQPEGDLETKRPLIILAHGGSFVAGVRTNPSMVSLGNQFAKRGYVVASISYRLMSAFDLFNASSALNGVAEAISDGRSAVRFFRKTYEEGNEYGIDPDQIYFGGNSAGGVIAVHVAFMEEGDVTNEDLLIALENNGGIEGNSGNEGYSSAVNGAISLAGAIADVDFITSSDFDKILISCHGDADNTVPNFCGQPLNNPVLPELCGGGAMFENSQEIGFDNHNHLVFEGSGHVPWEFGGSSEVAMVDFVSEHLYNSLDCAEVNLDEVVVGEPIIFPNPTESRFTIESLKRIYKVVISNLKGVEIFRAEKAININIEHLPKGVYMVEMIDEDQKVTRSKVVKM